MTKKKQKKKIKKSPSENKEAAIQNSVEKDICKEVEKTVQKNTKCIARKIGYVVIIVINIILLVLAHNIQDFEWAFITDNFQDVLWAVDLSLGVTILTSMILIVYDQKTFKHSIEIIQNMFSAISMIVMFSVFPFDFTEIVDATWINTVSRYGLLVGVVFTGIGIMGHIFGIFKDIAEE